jgi:hypothetical protein
MIKHKLREWSKRYLPAEIIGTLTAVGAASIAHAFSDNLVLIAYTGSIGEAIGFYSTVLIQNIIIVVNKNRNTQFSFAHLTKIIAHLLMEFGPAGIIDGLVLRPFFMYLFPILLKNFTFGILIGKIAGDFTFYLLVITSYELKKKLKST